MQHIMVATDGSEGANRAVDAVAELAKAFGGELLIVTVGENLSSEEMRQLERAEGNIGDALDVLSKQILAAAKNRAERLGINNVQLRPA
jgi:nucleotide-binding universal stress UspA family protein